MTGNRVVRDVNALRDLAERAAREAAEVVLAQCGRDLGAREKASARDLVTEADLAAEQRIVELLRAERPNDMIVGEEFGTRAGDSGLRWGIDPLDGTSNFVAGIPHWAVVVGCEDEHGSLVGVVYDPNRDELFAAARGTGAFMNGMAIRASSCPSIASAIAAFGPAWTHGWDEHRMWVTNRLVGAVAHARQMGSLALDLAWAAAGRFDLFYYDSELNLWDVAMRVIAEEAGLVVEQLLPDARRPGSLVASPPQLRESVAALFERRTGQRSYGSPGAA